MKVEGVLMSRVGIAVEWKLIPLSLEKAPTQESDLPFIILTLNSVWRK